MHEKAQNFVVPIPFAEAWHDEQIDELFSSLLGGAGLEGAGGGVNRDDRAVLGMEVNGDEAATSVQGVERGGGVAQGGISVAGLRVF